MERVLAPIALFVYNRPEHTRQTIEALKHNDLASQSELVIFSDGAKTPANQDKVGRVREYLNQINGFKSVSIITRETNYGLARSIINGVTETLNKFGKIIVLEDDLVTSPFFLTYMNDALDLYENDDLVASIHGYVYPVAQKLPETFFIKGADCWGWATWKRAWAIMEQDGQKLLTAIKKNYLVKDFDYGGQYPFTMMLENQVMGVNNSWAIRWYASAFLAGKFTLYPGRSLVKNIGMDSSGANTPQTNLYEVTLSSLPISVTRQPIEENPEIREQFGSFLAKTNIDKLKIKFKFWINKLLFILRGNARQN